MTIYQFNLSTTEPNNSIGLIRVRQDDDESQIFKATILENGMPKNLTGLFATFNMTDVKQHIVIDRALIVDAENGVVEYRLDRVAMQSIGRCNAYFSFGKKEEDTDILFSTKDFNYNVIWSSLSFPLHHGCDYIWQVSDLIDSLKDFISSGMGSFYEWFESVKEILSSVDPGGILLKELIDARYSLPFDTKHDTLAERLNYAESLLKELYDNQQKFEPEEQDWRYLGDMSPLKNAVMQSFYIDSKTGTRYMTQVIDGGYRLSRHKQNGQEVDFMQCIGGGHGTHNGYRWMDNELWIYSYYANKDNKPTLVRFKYKAGIIQKFGDNGMKEVYTAQTNNPYITPIVNEKEGLILFRYGTDDGNGQTHNWCEVRRLSDIDKQVDNVLYTVDIPLNLTTETDPMQGVEFAEGVLYWYTGDGNTKNGNLVTAFSLETGKKMWQRSADVGGFLGTFPGDFAEGEGMQFYVDSETGKHALLIGVTVGAANNRTHQIFGIFQEGVYEQLTANATANIPTDGGGRRKPLPLETNKLSDIKEYGCYYLTTEDVKKYTDFPIPVTWNSSGWSFDVSPSNSSGNITQTLTRSTFSKAPQIFIRNVSLTDVGLWGIVRIDSPVGDPMPDSITKLADFNIAGMSVYMTLEQSIKMTDFPRNDGVAGWFVENSFANTGGTFLQKVSRSNITNSHSYYIRSVATDKTVSKWTLFSGELID